MLSSTAVTRGSRAVTSNNPWGITDMAESKWTVLAALLNPQTLLIVALMLAIMFGVVQGTDLIEIIRDFLSSLQGGPR